MILFKHSKDLQSYLTKVKSEKKSTIGFVPTMGALHAGHLSLIVQCKQQAQLTVCSIFVNPTQFNNPEDFKKYPTTIENDIAILEGSDCDILFLPDVEEIYPDEASKNKHFDLGYLETVLEGKFRPGHFQGVCLVVEKLLNIINPDMLFIGQKDFQQCKVIKKLIDIMQKDIELVVCPTLREENGLAMSSRNLRLSETEKNLASELHQSLSSIKNNIGNAPFSELKRNAIAHLSEMGIKIEYLELANKNLEPITDSEGSDEEILLIAAFVNEVRLIDNLWINS